MADRQPYLNGNFYGPAVPPPTKTNRRRRILCTILKVAIGLIVVVGILLLILGLVYRPTELEFNVTNAKLTQFNFTENPNFSRNPNMTAGHKVYYKLAVNVTIRNPNKRYRVYYDINQMLLVYKNRMLGTQWLPAFFQDTKSTAVVSNKDFEGQRLIFFTRDEILELNSEKRSGLYSIDIMFLLQLRMKSGGVVLKLKPEVYCGLKVPLINGPKPRNTVVNFFPNTACDFKF